MFKRGLRKCVDFMRLKWSATPRYALELALALGAVVCHLADGRGEAVVSQSVSKGEPVSELFPWSTELVLRILKDDVCSFLVLVLLWLLMLPFLLLLLLLRRLLYLWRSRWLLLML